MSKQQLKETMELLQKGGAVPLNVVEAVNDLLGAVEGLEASKEIEIECHVQSCLDYQAQIQTLNDENQSLRRSLTSEAVKDAKYNAEIMRLRKELEDTKLQRDTANESKEYAKAEYLDQCRANGELRKELEEAWVSIRQYGIALMAAKHLSKEIDHTGAPKDTFTFRAIAKNMKMLMSLVDWKTIDSLSVGREGEGNQ